ncbi:Zn-dependent exopeptidase [Rhizoclosmatium globosum]|uniref:Peptide hydrolase n=1 Tax=Rhizoclosmatium globosum TaxID=329046 RepID=A0A1Y2CD06_9FUNG|nr:Zn-dependent exopeptidase [Rhizoclosmatium globosum]|eukprot:ORY44923.1 Zn-dependent exopeptidase [Rhizoclosmatium globosum]
MLDKGLRKVAISHTEIKWVSLEERLGFVRKGVGFVDLTDTPGPVSLVPPAKPFPFPAIPQQLNRDSIRIQNTLIANTSTAAMAHWLVPFTSLPSRYELSSNGWHASDDVFKQALALAKQSAIHPDLKISVQKFKHKGYKQYSVIVRVDSANQAAKNDSVFPILILAANLDSFNIYNPFSANSPGANENGSGCAVLFEILRVLITTNSVPSRRAVEFHFYAASLFGGKVGSWQVASQYSNDGVAVAGVLGITRTGWDPSTRARVDKRVGVATGSANKEFSKLLKTALTEEGFFPIERECGFACADHSPWHIFGYPTAHSFEAEEGLESPYAHQSSDTVETVSFARMKAFVGVGLRVIVRLCF